MKSINIVLTFLVAIGIPASALDLRIAREPSGQIRFDWDSVIDLDYELRSSESMDSFSLWDSVSGAITATDTNTSFVYDLPATEKNFYKVFNLSSLVLPYISINSPLTNETVSGELLVSMSAYDDSRITAVSLFLDGVPVAEITGGLLYAKVNTAHFSNGVHTLTARVQDNEGIGPLGGNPDLMTVANVAEASPVSVTFTNPVRWPQAPAVFTVDVPIQVETDIYPADWTVNVWDEDHTLVRTFAGSVTGSLILTNWDGQAQNSNAVPVEKGYLVEVLVAGTSSSSSMLSSGSGELDGYTLQGKAMNKYGIREAIYSKSVFTPAHFQESGLTITEWDKKTGEMVVVSRPKPEYIPSHDCVLTKRIPEMRSASTTMTSSSMESSSATGSVSAPVWKEAYWQSGEIILARQKYKGTLPIPLFSFRYLFNGRLHAWMDGALKDGFINSSLPASRSVHGGVVNIMEDTGSYPQFLTLLSNTAVTALYYHGHSDGRHIGFTEYLPGEGLTNTQIAVARYNFTQPLVTNKLPLRYTFYRPYNFVFMDACSSANGNFPEAFGIGKAIPPSWYIAGAAAYRNRAYMGWGADTRNSLINDDSFQWSQKFFEKWL